MRYLEGLVIGVCAILFVAVVLFALDYGLDELERRDTTPIGELSK